MQQVKGSEMPRHMQQDALARFVHRFTRDHVPAWVKQDMPNGKPYPIQFDSDEDWLASTLFWVGNTGLSNKHKYCESSPTWPDNPELRKGNK